MRGSGVGGMRGNKRDMRLLVILYRLLPLAVAFRRDYRRWLFFGRPATRTRRPCLDARGALT